MRHRPERRRQAGFGLLEAIVALVLLASTGTAVFAWINTSLDAVRRVRDREAVDARLAQMAAWAQTLDLVRAPEGEAEIAPGLRVRWTARPLRPLQPVAPLPGGTGTPWRIALYELDLEGHDADRPAAETLRLHTRRLGAERDPLDIVVDSDEAR
ncbi:type II secretion system GspH family protein [Rubrivivax sp. JA1024]|nr:type II secretion system GspH family protein [Rubrivivax sp. JA1024]